MLSKEVVENALSKIPFRLDDPHFFPALSQRVLALERNHYPPESVQRIIFEACGALDEAELLGSVREPLNESAARTLKLARCFARLLIDEKGAFVSPVLQELIQFLTRHHYVLGPGREEDSLARRHLLNVLHTLQEDPEVLRLIRGFTKPESFPYADELVRHTLLLPHEQSITDGDVRRAVLAAWMTLLRQSVGSCFATAPALLIQREQPRALLADLQELLSLGWLRRVIRGKEHTVPISPSWGMGDLRKPLELDEHAQPLASSRGFQEALEVAGLLQATLTPNEKIWKCAELIKIAAQFSPREMTAETLLRTLLMRQNNLKEEDLISLDPPSHELFLAHSLTGFIPQEGKSVLKNRFKEQFKAAKNAYCRVVENALLKAWEYTLASYSETKLQFTRWNLYHSLGMDREMAGGIGQLLYGFFSQKLEEFKQKFEEMERQIERLYLELKGLEGLSRIADSEQKMQWIRTDYSSRRHEYERVLEAREEVWEKANACSGAYAHVIQAYDSLIPRYFQEIYDAEMSEVATHLYEDSPAGFRLLYKHGRAHPSAWTMIHTPEQFIAYLSDFFMATENELLQREGSKGLEKELSDAVTQMIHHLKTDEFLTTAFVRVAKAHDTVAIANPLANLEKIEKKPWAYTSGGTMETLVEIYFGLERPPNKEGKWVESDTELCALILEILRSLPAQWDVYYLNHPDRSLLMQSPTHAFLLQPGHSLIQKSWREEEATYHYTWVRDRYYLPRKAFVEGLVLSKAQVETLLTKTVDILPATWRPSFSKMAKGLLGETTLSQLSQRMREDLSRDPMLARHRQQVMQLVHGSFYSNLPLTSSSELLFAIERIFSLLIPDDGHLEFLKQVVKYAERLLGSGAYPPFLTPGELLAMCQSLWILVHGKVSDSVDGFGLLLSALRNCGYAMPEPLIFADTNWPGRLFAFIVNPSSAELELWRVDPYGHQGLPMSEWTHLKDGSSHISWLIYSRPFEYRLK